MVASPDGFEFAAQTDTGLVRVRNEDAVGINPALGIAVLADGMGGYNAGEVASRIAIQVTSQCIEDGLHRLRCKAVQDPSPVLRDTFRNILVDAFQKANAAVLGAAQADLQCAGMGTTLIAAMFRGKQVSIAHVGDSRAYRLRGGHLSQLARDHSLIQEQIDAGLISAEWAPYSQHRYLITRAVGIATGLEVEAHDYSAEPGDLYLLCSDGLSDMLMDQQIAEVLEHAADSLEDMCARLIDAANQKGGHDNISVVLIKIPLQPEDRIGRLGRMFVWAMKYA